MKQITEVTLVKTKQTTNCIVYSDGETTFYLHKKFIAGDTPEKLVLNVKEP